MPIKQKLKMVSGVMALAGVISITGNVSAQDLVGPVSDIVAQPLQQDNIALPLDSGTLSYNIDGNAADPLDRAQFHLTVGDLVVQNTRTIVNEPFLHSRKTERGVVFANNNNDTTVIVSSSKFFQENFGLETRHQSETAGVAALGMGAVARTEKSSFDGNGFERTSVILETGVLDAAIVDDTYLFDATLDDLGFVVLNVELLDVPLVQGLGTGALTGDFAIVVLPDQLGLPITSDPATNVAAVSALLSTLPVPALPIPGL